MITFIVKVCGKGKRVLSFTCDDVNNDGCADQRRDGVEGDDTTLAREETDEVADEGHDSSAEDGGREKHTMVVCGEQQSGNMGYGEADESHRATEGGGNSREQTSDDKQPVANPQDVDAEVLGIAVA